MAKGIQQSGHGRGVPALSGGSQVLGNVWRNHPLPLWRGKTMAQSPVWSRHHGQMGV